MKGWILLIAILIEIGQALYAQNDLFRFVLPSSMVLERVDTTDQIVMYDYYDTNHLDWLQMAVYQGDGYEVSYGQNSTNEGFHWEYDNQDRIVRYGHRKGRTLVGYSFYPDGRLAGYNIVTEDTLSQRLASTDDSFFQEFHPNGALKMKYYFTNPVQEYKEFWPNGTLRIKAGYIADEFTYCGKYREYNEIGKLIVKGQHCIDEHQLDPMKKCGTWKYYENGKLIKKERF